MWKGSNVAAGGTDSNHLGLTVNFRINRTQNSVNKTRHSEHVSKNQTNLQYLNVNTNRGLGAQSDIAMESDSPPPPKSQN
jgi:hypothetical protein